MCEHAVRVIFLLLESATFGYRFVLKTIGRSVRKVAFCEFATAMATMFDDACASGIAMIDKNLVWISIVMRVGLEKKLASMAERRFGASLQPDVFVVIVIATGFEGRSGW